jgi:hypothetical protein
MGGRSYRQQNPCSDIQTCSMGRECQRPLAACLACAAHPCTMVHCPSRRATAPPLPLRHAAHIPLGPPFGDQVLNDKMAFWLGPLVALCVAAPRGKEKKSLAVDRSLSTFRPKSNFHIRHRGGLSGASCLPRGPRRFCDRTGHVRLLSLATSSSSFLTSPQFLSQSSGNSHMGCVCEVDQR